MSDIAEINRTCYASGSIIREYAALSEIFPAEEAILRSLRGTGVASILDIGVGGGRTTAPLLQLSRNYVAIDFSAGMIEAARARHPSVDYRVCDMRRVGKELEGASFDLILISYNGLDYLSHPERLSVLKQARALLSEKGTFVFSSHHLGYSGMSDGFRPAPVEPTRNPLRLGVRVLRAASQTLRKYRHYSMNHSQQQISEDYAILNDWAHDYRLLTYYIDPAAQERQLRQAGFLGEVAVYHPFMRPDERGAAPFEAAPWLYYTVRKNQD